VIAGWGAITIEAIDYELVWFGHDPGRAPLGQFADAHVVDAPVRRLVSGYLMFSGDAVADGEALTVSSHGHDLASLTADESGFTLEFGRSGRLDGAIGRNDTGIALVPDAGTELSLSDDGLTLSGLPADSRDKVWGVTAVHGPAAIKVENRIRLLRSLQEVGGRRA
jgi:hypothetical protein